MINTNKFYSSTLEKMVPWAFEDSEETSSLLLESPDCLFSCFFDSVTYPHGLPRDSTPSNFFAQVLGGLHALYHLWALVLLSSV